jgi:superfamily I DNA/RNA helicase
MKRHKIFGPPGTGKTTYLIETMRNWLVSTGHGQDSVGFVTFTRSARAEALARLGGAEDEWNYVRTLHALCYRSLGISNNRMVSRSDLGRFADIVGIEIRGEGDKFEDETPFEELPLGDRLLRLNHLGRHRLLSLNQALAVLPVDVDEKVAKHFTVTYRDWKRHEGLLDFTDLLTEYIHRGNTFQSKLFMVDEAQDLSPLQWQVVSKMGANADYYFVAGDDDQAIYTWAGATAEEFNAWEADDVKILHQSYRLPEGVWQLCSQISSRIAQRTQKSFGYRPGGDANTVEETGVLPDIDSTKGHLILYRFAQRGKDIAKALRFDSVLFGGVLSPLGNPKTHKALSALAKEPRVRNRDERRALIDMGASEESTNVADCSRCWYLDYLVECQEKYGLSLMLNPPVQLMSIHQSKGREADTVILDTTLSRSAYEHLLDDPDDEHRVWYVGASRAKEKLVILQGAGSFQYEF